MFKFEKIEAAKYTQTNNVEKVVEFTPPGVDIDNIVKVLSLSVDCKVTSITANDGYAEVMIRANFKLLYIDSEMLARGVDYNADFTMTVDGDMLAGDNLLAQVGVVDADVDVTTALMLSASVEVSVLSASNHEMETLVDAEDCYKSLTKMILPYVFCKKTEIIPIDDEVMIGGEVSSILLLDTNCVVRKHTILKDMIKIDGVAYANITYRDEDNIFNRIMEIPVICEMDAEDIQEGDRVLIEASVINSKIVLAGVTDDNVIRFEGDLQFKAIITKFNEVEVVQDMFMLTNEMEVKKSEETYLNFLSSKYFIEKETGTATLRENKAVIDSIICLPYSKAYISKTEKVEAGLLIEGVVNTDVIYTDENGYNSVRAEVPFSFVVAGEFSENSNARCVVEQISARAKAEREIEIAMMLGINVTEFDNYKFEHISGVEVGEEKEQNTSGVSLYIGSKGDEMWDICKALTATPENIMLQNPTIKTPLEEGKKIVYFRTLKM